jgi:hypothetical protein
MRRLTLSLLFILAAYPAYAGPTCTKEPRDKWVSESQMKEKIASLGYKFTVFKVTDGNCYEIYGRNKSGKRIEVYFHPVTGAIVEEHS